MTALFEAFPTPDSTVKRKHILSIGFFAILLSCCPFSTDADAQEAPPQVAQSTKQISFQQTAWQTKHLHNAEETEQMVRQLQELGCEVTQSQHNGHIDVRYRCLNWQTMDLQTDDQVTQWKTWLQQSGLQTIVRNPAADTEMPTVSYRLLQNKRAHLHDSEQVGQIVSIFKMLGCVVETSDHNGHLDLSVDCPDWVTMGVESEDAAHQWQAWLDSNGFETKHTHKH